MEPKRIKGGLPTPQNKVRTVLGSKPSYNTKKETYICHRCGKKKREADFLDIESPLFTDGKSPICNDCVIDFLGSDWEDADLLCRTLDLPFIPRELEKMKDEADKTATAPHGFLMYAKKFKEDKFQGLHWNDYYQVYSQLKEQGLLELELPQLRQKRMEEMRERWGLAMGERDLIYLENLYQELVTSYGIVDAVSSDQAMKLCRLSLSIDQAIENGESPDKLIASYEKIIKVGNFTEDKAVNSSDITSIGELVSWLERRGWVNKWYDGAKHDIIDETLESFQQFSRKLYTNETGLADDIETRMEMLRIVDENGPRNSLEEATVLGDSSFFLDEPEVEDDYEDDDDDEEGEF